MRGMNLDHPEAGGERALGRDGEGAMHSVDLVDSHFVRHGETIIERNGARRDRAPSASRFRNGAVARSRPIGAAFPPGMRELDAGARALTLDKAHDPFEGLEMLFAPDAEVLRRNPALGSDRRRLREHQPRAARGSRAKMGEMPVVGVAVDGRILAHRRNADPVGEVDVAHAKFAEQVRHGSIVSIFG